MDNISKEIDLLLNNFWITKDEKREEYYFLKQNQYKIKDFINKNLGNKLIIHNNFIKLEKIPAKPNINMGIASFQSPFDYVLLFLLLLFLEDKTKGDRFILSSLIESIKNIAITLKLNNIPDWNLSSNRKSLIRVLNFLEESYVIILNERQTIKFEDDINAEALYEATGLANYLIPTFDADINTFNQASDFLRYEEENINFQDMRRYKVYRHLLYTPAVHKTDLTNLEEDYLKKMHKVIENEIKENIDMEVEITKNLSLIYAPENTIQKEYFPNTKKISDIVLLLNQEIIDFAKVNNISLIEDESFKISKSDFKKIIEKLRQNKKDYFSKNILDLSFEKYYQEVLTVLINFNFIKENEEEIIVLPMIYRFLGKTPKVKETNIVQLEMEVTNE